MVLWLAAFAGLMWLVAASQVFRASTLILWGAANVILACVAAGWGFFHPRALLKAREPAMRWAFWLTLFGMLSLLLATEGLRTLMQQINPSVAAARGLIFLVGIILYPLLFVAALMLGQLGAALGGFAVSDPAETERAVRAGVGAWWLSLLLAYIAGTMALLTGLG